MKDLEVFVEIVDEDGMEGKFAARYGA